MMDYGVSADELGRLADETGSAADSASYLTLMTLALVLDDNEDRSL